MPLRAAAIACSRTPKWMLRPAYDSGWKSPNPLRYVFVDGSRSAEPPTSSGKLPAIAFMTVPPASRVATLPFSAVNVGQASVSGSLPSRARSNCAASAPLAAFQRA